ncbi:MAG TPA: polysaccharide deacetylase family protein, partial [Candidatus Elarobacter sp.]|nr:polysaccharide deacetylase family protein [Candidatus Elarobacter sp.]
GFTHTRITELGPAGIRHETAQARREIARVVGTRPHWFRPPYGAQNMRTFLATRVQGMDIAVWAVDPSDAMTTRGFEIATDEHGALTMHAAGAPMALDPGSVLLLHDTPAGDDSDGSVSATEAADRKVALIARILDGINSVGGRTATLTELLAAGVGSRRIWRSAGY